MIILLLLISISGQLSGQLRDLDIDLITHESFTSKLGKEKTQWLYYFNLFLILLTAIIGIALRVVPKFLFPLLIFGAIYLINRSIKENVEENHKNPFGPSIGIIALLYTSLVVILSIVSPHRMTTFIAPL
jgi:4-hydroxybenzoate polyprenyltransferase